MKSSHLPRRAAVVLIGIALLAGCSNLGRPHAFSNSFLPPAPPTDGEAAEPVPEPPTIQATIWPKDPPVFLHRELRVPPQADLQRLIRQAEEKFQQGVRKQHRGDSEGARADFDAAIDLLLSVPESAPERAALEKKFEELVERIHRLDVEELGAGQTDQANGFDRAPIEEILELTFPVDPRLKDRVIEQVRATVSQLPLEFNTEVLRYINYFSSEKGRRTLIAGLQRSGRYRDMIRRILDEEGVPQELIFLAQAESGFLPRAVSHKAAAGMWQFVKFRGLQYGLRQNAYFDERLDPEKATRAGARHLRDLFQQFGDWYLAMAAYNCGPGCVARAVERTGYADIWQLRDRNVLPRETANYVPIILAMTIMAKNPKDYGLENVELERPLVYDTVELEAPTGLALVSDILDVPLNELRALNPALLKSFAPAGYGLHIPKGSSQILMAGLKQIPPARRASWRLHRTIEEDTLDSIARRYRVTPQAIAAANADRLERLTAGRTLVIPVSDSPLEKTAVKRPAARSGKSVAAAGRTTGKNAAKTAPAKSRSATAARHPARRGSSALPVALNSARKSKSAAR